MAKMRKALGWIGVAASAAALLHDLVLPGMQVLDLADQFLRPGTLTPDARLHAAEVAATTASQFALHLSILLAATVLTLGRLPIAALPWIVVGSSLVNALPADLWIYETGLPTAFVISALALTVLSVLRRTRNVGRVIAAGVAWISIGTLLLFHVVVIVGTDAAWRTEALETARALAAAGAEASDCAPLGIQCGSSGPAGVEGTLLELPEDISGFVRGRAASMEAREMSGIQSSGSGRFAWSLASNSDSVRYAVDMRRMKANAERTSILISVLIASANMFWAPAGAVLILAHQRAISRRQRKPAAIFGAAP